MPKLSKLMSIAKESVETGDYDDRVPVTEVDAIDNGDALFEREEGYALAAEALFERARTLETLLDAIKDVPESAATPELAAAVQATIILADEPAIATESADDVTDVKAKGEGWEKTKSRAADAVKTVSAAVKKVIMMIIEFLEDVWAWLTSSRRSITKELEAQKAKITSGKQSVEVTYTNRMKALTLSGSFGPDIAKATMKRYAEVLAAGTYTVQNVLNFTTSFKEAKYKPEALKNFNAHVINRTQGAFDWQDGPGAIKTAQIFDGEGGLYTEISVDGSKDISIRTEAKDSDVTTSAASFSRNDMVEINRYGLTLMKGVAACEPEIKKVQNSLRRLMGVDIGLMFLTQGAGGVRINGTSPAVVFMRMRQFLSFANKFCVGMAVKGAGSAAYVGRAYLAGEAPSHEEDTNQAHGEIEYPRLGHAA